MKKSQFVVGSVIVSLGVAAASGQAGSSDHRPASRADTYLTRANAELADTGFSVTSVRLAHVLEGREVYALQGPDTACILVAGQGQADGHSQQMDCTPLHSALNPETPITTGFPLSGKEGFVDLTWTTATDSGAVKARSEAGAALRPAVASNVVATVRRGAADTKPASLSWATPEGTTIVDLPSANQRQGRLEAYAAAAASSAR